MTTAAAVAQQPSELACVLIPLQQGQLLLPSVCIAEIMPWRRIKVLQGVPDWCLGLLGWRGETIPVLRFERLNQPKSSGPAPGRCLVVMNRTGAGVAPFYALAAEGLPRLVQLSDADIGDQDERPGRAEARLVRLGTETASIPSLNFIEQQVVELGQQIGA
ncbi:MAG: chemotaxis protein CheW [Pseudomonadales bacterium]